MVCKNLKQQAARTVLFTVVVCVLGASAAWSDEGPLDRRRGSIRPPGPVAAERSKSPGGDQIPNPPPPQPPGPRVPQDWDAAQAPAPAEARSQRALPAWVLRLHALASRFDR